MVVVKMGGHGGAGNTDRADTVDLKDMVTISGVILEVVSKVAVMTMVGKVMVAIMVVKWMLATMRWLHYLVCLFFYYFVQSPHHSHPYIS
ncbi:hypothetical protein H920_01490 [Fukomys damarensis]|uniref:Uncharacterized protein n=1 Tax=Fukomys damarensis TaxID=885580 RepID=A0A091DYC2_FUKDA|nr:hypothetical protein H920_01490 [Fukomys damarensis]